MRPTSGYLANNAAETRGMSRAILDSDAVAEGPQITAYQLLNVPGYAPTDEGRAALVAAVLRCHWR